MFLVLTGCTTYTVSKVSENQVMVSKTTHILSFWGSSIFTCDLDKDGLFDSCEDNEVQTEDEIFRKQEEIRLEKERKQRLNQNSSFYEQKEVKPIIAPKQEVIKEEPIVYNKPELSQVQKKEAKKYKTDYDKSKVYLGLGISTSGDKVESEDLKYSKFNYSLGYLKKEEDSMYGVIYHVSAFRVYGSIPDLQTPNENLAFHHQVNINLLGGTYRKYAFSTNENSPYLRLDAGLAWSTNGKSLILSPFEDIKGFGLGANIGLGAAIKTDFGSINFDIYHTLYKSSEVKDINSGMTNFTIGLMF